jgi:hypothetical protein
MVSIETLKKNYILDNLEHDIYIFWFVNDVYEISGKFLTPCNLNNDENWNFLFDEITTFYKLTEVMQVYYIWNL